MKVIIVGAVAAGMSVAGKISRSGKDIEHVVYEKRSYSSLGACGIPFFVGGHIDNSDGLLARSNEKHIAAGINLRVRHQVEEIITKEKKVIVKDLETGKTFEDSYDELVITTGAHPIIPPIEGMDLENVFTATSKEDADAIKIASRNGHINKVVIIGAGFIGVEMAEAMLELGKEVTIIEGTSGPNPRVFDPEIGQHLVKELKAKTNARFGERVEKLKGTGIIKKVVTKTTEYDADMVIMSVGFRPTTTRNIKFDVEPEMLGNGAIVVNNKMQTSIPHVHSAGDCASTVHKITGKNIYMPLATTARKMGKILGENLVGNKEVFPGTLGTSGFRFEGVELFRTGLSAQEAVDLNIEIIVTYLELADHASYVRNMQPLYGKIIVEKKTRRIIGAQFAGTNGAACLRTNTMAGLMWNGIKDFELPNFDFTYTPPFTKTTDIIHLLGSISSKKN